MKLPKPTIPKQCLGCNSYLTNCKGYLPSKFVSYWTAFKDGYCPCKKCLVKVSCKDPKYTISNGRYSKVKGCLEFKQRVLDFKEYCEIRELRTTKIKIKKR